MKKFVMILLVICMAVTLFACGGSGSSIKFGDTYEANGRSFGIPEGFTDDGDGWFTNSETGTRIAILNNDMSSYERSLFDGRDDDEYDHFFDIMLSGFEDSIGAVPKGDSEKVTAVGMKGMVHEAEYEGQFLKICGMVDLENEGTIMLVLSADNEEDVFYKNFDSILDEIK